MRTCKSWSNWRKGGLLFSLVLIDVGLYFTIITHSLVNCVLQSLSNHAHVDLPTHSLLGWGATRFKNCICCVIREKVTISYLYYLAMSTINVHRAMTYLFQFRGPSPSALATIHHRNQEKLAFFGDRLGMTMCALVFQGNFVQWSQVVQRYNKNTKITFYDMLILHVDGVNMYKN